MNDQVIRELPLGYEQIRTATIDMQFNMASDLYTGSLLSTLVASKPGGRFLELGTGTGLATAWLLDGMDNKSKLVTIENNALLQQVASECIPDSRVEYLLADGFEWISQYRGEGFDLIFADAMPGKYELFEETIAMLKPAGFYIIDDMLPQPNWPAGHDLKVLEFIRMLEQRTDLALTKLNWSTGIMIVVKK